jgi:hypothetical protein
MCKKHCSLALLLLLTFLGLGVSSSTCAFVKGIYLTQTTLENTSYLTYLLEQAKRVGINTFVVDMEIPSKRYQKNVQLLKENNIRYVARIIVFPDGGRPEQITDPSYWEKRYKLVETAISYGAQEIQLDYIRYNTKQPASADNAKHVMHVVQFFKEKLAPQGIPLQADVFGISSYGESKHIGQNLKMMANTVDALCPMVYPSHFEPFRQHAVTPYETVYGSLRALRTQFADNLPVKLYAYIEISNYRYPLSNTKRRAYVVAEMKAVKDAAADGWYVWSAHNKYDFLFNLMEELAVQDEGTGINEKTFQAEATPLKAATYVDTKTVVADAIPVKKATATPTIQTKTALAKKLSGPIASRNFHRFTWMLGFRHYSEF